MDGASHDLDIYLVNDDGTIQYARNSNNLGFDPIEVMDFTVEGTGPITTNVVIARSNEGAQTPVAFKYVFFRSGNMEIVDFNSDFGNSTIVGQANASSAITVGAVLYSNTPSFGVIPTPASFSSRGGMRTNFVDRQKPDIMAPNGVNTTVDLGGVGDFDMDGLPNFSGTSAAAPHVAGALALILEARKRFELAPTNRQQAIDVMKNGAFDMEGAGYDRDSGNGFLQLNESIKAFASPSPLVMDYTVPPLATPGSASFELTIEGSSFLLILSFILMAILYRQPW